MPMTFGKKLKEDSCLFRLFPGNMRESVKTFLDVKSYNNAVYGRVVTNHKTRDLKQVVKNVLALQ